DTQFQRVRIRQALGSLVQAGLTTDSITTSARALRRTRDSLEDMVADFTKRHVTFDRGDILIAPDAFATTHDEIARRLLSNGLQAIASRDYAPRARKLLPLLDAPVPREGVTLHGCILRTDSGGLRLAREPEAARRAGVAALGTIWDGRWTVSGPQTDVQIRATGPDGLRHCPDWRKTGLPRASLLAAPAVWRDNMLIAAPLAGMAGDWRANCTIPFTSEGFWR
ncbi:MAG: tRNA(Ile)-lysidine synthetase, partial [Pseudomonadota bacterium]